MKTLLLLSLFVVARTSLAAEMRGTEAAALTMAVEAFQNIYAKPDLRHYRVAHHRHGDQLEITFMADQPKKKFGPGEAGTGGGSIYGPDMTYVVSLSRLKILRYNFYR